MIVEVGVVPRHPLFQEMLDDSIFGLTQSTTSYRDFRSDVPTGRLPTPPVPVVPVHAWSGAPSGLGGEPKRDLHRFQADLYGFVTDVHLRS